MTKLRSYVYYLYPLVCALVPVSHSVFTRVRTPKCCVEWRPIAPNSNGYGYDQRFRGDDEIAIEMERVALKPIEENRRKRGLLGKWAHSPKSGVVVSKEMTDYIEETTPIGYDMLWRRFVEDDAEKWQ